LIEPKMNPTYPWSRNADGIPTMVMSFRALWSNATARFPLSFENRERAR